MFGSRLYLQAARTKRKNGKIGKLKKLTLFHKSEILTEKYVHYFGASWSISPRSRKRSTVTSNATGFRRSAAFVYLFIYCFKAACPLVLLTRTTKMSVSVGHRWNDPERKT